MNKKEEFCLCRSASNWFNCCNEGILTAAQVELFVGKLVEIRRVVDGSNEWLVGRRSVSNVLPVYISEKRMHTDIIQVVEAILGVTTESVFDFLSK